MKVLVVGGTFDSMEGSPSTILTQLISGMRKHHPGDFIVVNGGKIADLEPMVQTAHLYDHIVWMPNVSNNERKYVQDIKHYNPHCLLVTSKRNIGDKYTLAQVIAHALQLKSNLLLEISSYTPAAAPARPASYVGRVLDPLANCYKGWTDDFDDLGLVIAIRLMELSKFIRMGSRHEKELAASPPNVDNRFFEIVRKHADAFHQLIPEIQTTRFLGNASFRCRHGFPSFKEQGRIFVSPRNVDKRYLIKPNFVVVAQGTNNVLYYGKNKPSVDTPIQLILYRIYQEVRYMTHGHVYVKGAPRTNHTISCGALNEAAEILRTQPNPTEANFAVNLRGHGFIALAKDLDFLDSLEFEPRPSPENVWKY